MECFQNLLEIISKELVALWTKAEKVETYMKHTFVLDSLSCLHLEVIGTQTHL